MSRRLLWIYAALMLVVGAGYVRYDLYNMDGDGTAFLDISQGLTDGHAGMAINGYWNPGYPAVLAVGRVVAHATTWNELAVARWTNLGVFALAMAACLFFTTGLVKLRALRGDEDRAALPAWALHLLGLGLLMMSAGRELLIAGVRADTLLLALLLVAMGLLLRVQAGAGVWAYAALGMALGFAYLTKSFAFLPAMFLVLGMSALGLRREGEARKKLVGGAVLTGVVFAALAGPYVVAVSRQLGHLSTGDSARLNYCFFIDQTPRWHEWHAHDLGHAGGVFTHAEKVLAEQPPVYSYAAHAVGTFPLWFDPAYWADGLTPRFWLKGHVLRLVRCSELLVRFLLGRPEVFLLLAVLLVCGAVWPRWREMRVWGAPVLWGLLMLGIYFPIDLQDRYLTAPFLLVLLPVFAWLGRRENDRVQMVAGGLVMLFAGTALLQAGTYVAERRRVIPDAVRGESGYSPEITQAARGLAVLGVRPGDKVACYGDAACYTDHYWARMAGAQILAEVQTPDNANTLTEWNGIADKGAVTAPLAAMGLRYVVTVFPNSAAKPEGWVELGTSDYFALRLGGAR
jgi:hypothetical protein